MNIKNFQRHFDIFFSLKDSILEIKLSIYYFMCWFLHKNKIGLSKVGKWKSKQSLRWFFLSKAIYYFHFQVRILKIDLIYYCIFLCFPEEVAQLIWKQLVWMGVWRWDDQRFKFDALSSANYKNTGLTTSTPLSSSSNHNYAFPFAAHTHK